MKKNLLFGMFAVAMLFATSCSNDSLELANSGDQARVSFALGVNSAVQTRAISDGLSVNELHYAVFDEAGARISAIEKVETAFSFPGTVELTLAKGQTYQVAFWAQNSACDAYTVSDDMTVEVSYEGVNNDEARDAFFKTVTFTVTGDAAMDVELKRPFAQINVGITAEDAEAAEVAGIEIASSKVVIANAASRINLLDGSVSEDVEVIYDFAEVPAESLTLDADGDGVAETYSYLSMSYVLVAAQKTILDNIDFTFRPESGNDIEFGEGLNNVPVQRNWRTNIVGKLLTGTIEFTISIDPSYEAESIVNDEGDVKVLGVKGGSGALYQTIAEAITAAETEIQLASGLWVLPNLNNKNVKFIGASKDSKIDLANIVNGSGSNIEFENVTIVKENEGYVGIQHVATISYTDCVFENVYWSYGIETFDNCVFNQTSADGYNIWTYGIGATFNNCTFNSAGKSALVYAEGGAAGVFEFNNCVFNASAPVTGKAAIEIDSHLRDQTVSITGCSQTGFANGSNSGNPLYNIKQAPERTTLIVDGVTI